MSELVLTSITKQFKGVEVLSEINMHIKNGEFICLLGPSGSGKSTILRIIGGFEHANAGSLVLNGEEIQHLPPNKRNFGFVFQDYALFPHMSAEKNVAYGLKMRKVAPLVLKERVVSAMKQVGLTGFEKRLPQQLSGGQRQRVAIARVIALQPSLLLYDEPLSNLDAKLRRQIRIEMKALQRELGITTIMVTHDQEEAITLGDRIAVLQNGVIQQFAAPMELYKSPANLFVAGFIGDPPINFMQVTSTATKSSTIAIGNYQYDVKKAGNRVDLPTEMVLGVRPEDVVLSKKEGIKGKVKTVEQLGAHSLAYVDIDHSISGNSICCVIGNEVEPQIGEQVFITFNYNNCLLFDRQTTMLLNDVKIEEGISFSQQLPLKEVTA
ncbi:ABC transporter ATP-binding protein [Paenibacillus endoradicis]|uniref:ABC transporter ATP-binding protein n=1 Tax=Paenibacillus endoradicis TaxID=2972487 RepID=UPI002158B105|nr:ABC transporter ATP-binding protein [Paenibacillus endoradicis]MCR8657140.1 ABC transporter ATP-binding protein [Paenibacillus endoradicis]